MKKQYFILWHLLFYTFSLCGQSPVFSQFYGLPAAMNPAYVSTVKGLQFNAGYRRQWGQVQQGFDTRFVNVAVRSCQAPLAFGAYFSDVKEPFLGYRQQEGGIQIGAFVARKKRFSLHGGLQAGIGQHRVDFARLLFSGQLDPVFGIQGPPSAYFLNDGSRVQTFEIGAGTVGRGLLSWRNSDLPASIGFSVYHLAGSRDVSFLRVPHTQAKRWTAHGSVTTPITTGLGRKDALYLNWLARYEWESSLQRGTVGVISQYQEAHIGLLYQWNKKPFTTRNTHGFTFTLGYDFALSDKSRCSIQYAFDGTLGGLGQSSTGGAHEILVTFTLPQSCLFKGKNIFGNTDCFDFQGKGYRRFLN
jgi:type IX secretion system PorP/SprF family membrane protein